MLKKLLVVSSTLLSLSCFANSPLTLSSEEKASVEANTATLMEHGITSHRDFIMQNEWIAKLSASALDSDIPVKMFAKFFEGYTMKNFVHIANVYHELTFLDLYFYMDMRGVDYSYEYRTELNDVRYCTGTILKSQVSTKFEEPRCRWRRK